MRALLFILAIGAMAGCVGYVSDVDGTPHSSGGGGGAGRAGGAAGGVIDVPDVVGGGAGGRESMDAPTDPAPDVASMKDARPQDAEAGVPPIGDGGPAVGDVPPFIPPDCPGDPAEGLTEYKDTFVVQHPYDLAPEDRYSFVDGIYTIWVMKGDKPHEVGNTTRERTEFRWSNMSSGVHLWSGDFKVAAGSEHVCIFQVKNSGPPTGVYLRVDRGNLHQLGGNDFLTGIYDKWFNLEVLVDVGAATGKVYINHCLKQTVSMPRGSGTWYFKNGTYTCDSTICKAYFKNIHLYQK
jgi:hypothetical protein